MKDEVEERRELLLRGTREILVHKMQLNEFEKGFVGKILLELQTGKDLTKRQEDYLNVIAEKYL